MMPLDQYNNDYGFQESNISGGQFNVDIPIWEPITIAPFSFDAINTMNTVVYPVVNDYSFEEAYMPMC